MKRILPTHKRLFALLLALFAGLGTAYAYSFSAVCPTGQTLYYNITDATNHYVEITCPGTPGSTGWDGYTKPTGDITLPSSVTCNNVTYVVKAIGDYAFFSCSDLTGTLTIPSSVNSIGYRAFYGCTGFDGTLTIGNSVTTIGEYAFYSCSGFTGGLTIPNSVTTIGDGAFYYCRGFTGSLTLGNSLTTIGQGAFWNCSGFTGSLTIPNSVTTISDRAFQSCGFESLTLSNSLTTIGYKAFWNCAAFTGSLIIPNSVTSIGDQAFSKCWFITSLTIGASVTSIGESAFEHCTYLDSIMVYPETPPALGTDAFAYVPTYIPVTVPCGKVDAYQNVSGWNAFTNMHEGYCDPLTYSINPDGVSVTVTGHVDSTNATGELIIPEVKSIDGVIYTVTEIGLSAFNGCTGLTGSLTLPRSVTTIGDRAFYGCTGFTGTLTIPNSVTTIGQWAFSGCSGFNGTLTIPSSVTSIGAGTFNQCTGFTGTLTIPNSVTTIGQWAFSSCSGFNGTLTIPASVTTIGRYAFSSCSGFTQVNYNAANCSNMESGETQPFIGCRGTLTIGSTVQRIPAFMFKDAGFTGTLTIPNSVTSIGKYAFNGCVGFTGSLTIPSSVTSIGAGAFNQCTGFTGTLTIPNSVTTIGEWAFSGCSGFNGTLTIPAYVTTIGRAAFNSCSGFTQVNYNAVNCSDMESSETPFEGCGGTLTIGSTVQRIPAFMFKDAGFTGTLTIPSSVTSIGASAFKNCNSFTHVNYNAANCTDDFTTFTAPFIGCGGTLTIGSTVQRIPAFMFKDAGFTGTLTIPSSVTSIGASAFKNCSGFSTVRYGAFNCADLGNSADKPFEGCGGTLIIVSGVHRIPDDMFFECTGFTGNLTIPNSVAEIGEDAFYHCTGFDGSLTIAGNSLTTIGYYAFNGCTGFTGSLVIPNSVTTIGGGAFYNCRGFTGDLVIPDSVIEIGPNAFGQCNGFNGNLTLGSNVTTIGQDAFYSCHGFTSITVLPETPPVLGTNAFAAVPTAIPVYVPCVALEDYQATTGWSAFTNYQCSETLTVYDGTATNQQIPAYIFYFDDFTRSQFVIPNADLADMIGSPITSMTFYTESNFPYTTESSADVYLKEVDYTTISAYEPKASATIVYSGYFDIVSNGNSCEMTINFSTPYTYNGGNLLVGVENTEDNYFMNIAFIGRTVNGASISGYNSSSTGTIPANQQNFIPKTTFSYSPSECSRPIGLAATDITTNSAMLDWTGFQDSYDIRYRKKVYFFEDFENGLPSGWTTIDNDGDGYNWHSTNTTTYSHSGSTVMVSYSYNEVTQTGLTPDNWLITPQLDLQGTMKVWLNAFHPSWAQEHFAIYLSTTGNSVSDFTTVLVPETTLTDGQFRAYTADLRAYAGQQGYIAIRHFNCTDMFALLVDDFGIFNAPDGTLEWETINDIEPGYTLNALEPNTDYEWQVRGRDCDGSNTYTEWSAANSFTTKTIVVDALHPFSEDFEGTDFAPAYWENIPSGNYQWSSSTYQYHSSSHSAFSSWYGDIYLVLPDLELSADAEAAQLSFWSYNTYPTDFAVGNNTVVLLNGGIETVLWSAETVSEEWVETTVDLSSYLGQTITLAFKYAGNDGNGWFVDDVEVSVTPVTTVTQTFALTAGTNWISTYVDITLDDLKDALVAALPGSTSMMIKSQSGYTSYNGTRWRGNLNEFDVAQMYQIMVSSDCEITLEGMPVNPAELSITISNGPNWIGFPFSESMSVTETFAEFEAVIGDMIKSKDAYTTYNGTRWRGGLTTFEPGQGYIYNSTAAETKTFIFPTGER